jgi:DNA-directed RNA polymerase specialized sigma24 family protein
MLISSGQYELNGLRRLDPQVIGAVCDWYYPDVYRFVRYRLGNEKLLEDIASKVFIRLLERITSGENPPARLSVWLLGITSFVVSDHLRKFHRRSTRKTPEWQNSISALSDEEQEVLALRFGLGQPLEEIAALMKKSVHAVKQLQLSALTDIQPQGQPKVITDDHLEDTLEFCLQALEHGINIETSLARFPMQATELLPILERAVQARAAAVRDIPPEIMQKGRAHVLHSAAEMRQQSRRAIVFIPLWPKSHSGSCSSGLVFNSVATITLFVASGIGLIYTPRLLHHANTSSYSAKVNFEKKSEQKYLPDAGKPFVFAPATEAPLPIYIATMLQEDQAAGNTKVSGTTEIIQNSAETLPPKEIKKPEKKTDKAKKPEKKPDKHDKHDKHDHNDEGGDD